MRSQHRMPSTVPSACGNRVFRNSANASSFPSRTCRSRSAKMSSTKILHPSCSPKNATLLPTTGPRSSRTGNSRDVRHVRNFLRALVAKTGSATDAGWGAGVSGSLLRGAWSHSRLHLGFGLHRAGLALHVDAAAEVRAFGNRHARRHDVAVHRSVVADVDLVACRHVAVYLAEDDDRLGKHLRLDSAVGTDRQHVIPQLNRPLDMAFNGQILAAVQLALNDDRLAN